MKSPEVLATANLTPISPAPLHISSPVVVPGLQDQADSLSTMTSFTIQDGASTTSSSTSAGNNSASSSDSILFNNENQGQERTYVKVTEGDAQQSHHQNGVEKDVSNTIPSYDTSKPYSISNDIPDAPVQPMQNSGQETPKQESTARDIQSLVDSIVDNTAENIKEAQLANHYPSQAVSLPSRPPIPPQQQDFSYPNPPGLPSALPPLSGTYGAGAPGTESRSYLHPSQATSYNALPPHGLSVDHAYATAAAPGAAASAAAMQPYGMNPTQDYDSFEEEERRYVTEAKWDRFPDGSRLFIGMFTVIFHTGRLLTWI